MSFFILLGIILTLIFNPTLIIGLISGTWSLFITLLWFYFVVCLILKSLEN